MGLFNFFSKKQPASESNIEPVLTQVEVFQITIESFCDRLKSGEVHNVLKELNLPVTQLIKASPSQIQSNPTDVKNGVIEVYFNDIPFFDVFDSFVHKIYKDSCSPRKQFFFYSTVEDVNTVCSFGNTLKEKFGNPIQTEFKSIFEISNLEDVNQGFASAHRDDCVAKWNINDQFFAWLQYKSNPAKQLSFHIDVV